MDLMVKLFLFFAVFLKVFTASELVEQLIEKDAESCDNVCEKTYPLHTYPSAEHLSGCKRGCRFYSILDVLGSTKDANKTLATCISSCSEAYSNTTEKLACSNGCESQMAFSLKQEQQPKTAHMLQPLMYVQAIYTNVVGQMSEFIASTWTLYVQEDTGKIVVSKTSPEAMPVLQELIAIDDTDFEKKLFGKDGKGFAEATVRREEFIRVQESVDRPSVDWLSCLSQQSGFPRMILLLVVLLAIAVAVWLCCATAATAQEQKVKSQIKMPAPPPPYDAESKVPLLASEDEDEEYNLV